MKPHIQNIIKLQSELKALLPMDDKHKKALDKKIRLEYNFNSNHIEGNTLTYGETELLLIYNQTSGDHDKRELDEMEGHDLAFKLITEWAKDKTRSITETDIKTLNQILLVKPFWKEAITADGQPTRREILVGEYKQQPNSVRLPNGEIFEYASVIDTPIKMQELVDWYQREEKKSELHPVELAAQLHHKYILIHPFDDGNGRVSRLLVNYVLMKNELPPIIIKSSEKKKYLQALRKADVGDMDSFIEYITGELEWSLNLSLKAVKGESLTERDDWEKELSILSKKGEQAPIRNSRELTIQRYNDSVLPTVRAIQSKIIISIQPYFETIDEDFYSEKGNLLNKLIWNIDQSLTPDFIGDSESFVYFVTLKNYNRNGIGFFDTRLAFEVKFFEHSYVLGWKNDSTGLITKPIDSVVTSVEVDELVQWAGENLTKQIKLNINNSSTQ